MASEEIRNKMEPSGSVAWAALVTWAAPRAGTRAYRHHGDDIEAAEADVAFLLPLQEVADARLVAFKPV